MPLHHHFMACVTLKGRNISCTLITTATGTMPQVQTGCHWKKLPHYQDEWIKRTDVPLGSWQKPSGPVNPDQSWPPGPLPEVRSPMQTTYHTQITPNSDEVSKPMGKKVRTKIDMGVNAHTEESGKELNAHSYMKYRILLDRNILCLP